MAVSDALADVLKRFTRTLVARYDPDDVLYELCHSIADILHASAAGVSLAARDGSLLFANATDERATRLENVQQETQQGPCFEAFRTGRPVLITAIADETRWPLYRASARQLNLFAVAGIPMAVETLRLGALNIYDDKVRDWTGDDLANASLLADIACSYVLYANQIDEARRVNEQLQHALDSRIIIEQAKGLLAGELGIPIGESFERLRKHARNNNATLRAVADAVVNLKLRP